MKPLDLSRFYKSHPVLHTERLILRPLSLGDAEAMFEYHRDPEVTKYVHFGAVATVEETRTVIEKILGELGEDKGFYFAIALKDPDWVMGTLDFHTIIPSHYVPELG